MATHLLDLSEVMVENGKERIQSTSSISALGESRKLNHRKLHQVQPLQHVSCTWLKAVGVRSIENCYQLSVWRFHRQG